ncbi:MAG: RDD family protein [Carboxylicivirga sp.]|jgi:uncharacterized RDD family membrane protein YckC/predicted nucleic acid-binding Zn ribbon protein|nr:RDD family protein [Carboxylicivirga sp.]
MMNILNCPQCGTANQAGTEFCMQCQFSLDKEYLTEPVCPQCLSLYPAGFNYCEKDGQQLIDKDNLTFQCVICQKAYASDVKFCTDDGGKVMAYGQAASGIIKELNPITTHVSVPIGQRFVASFLDGLIAMGLMLPSVACMFVGFHAIEDRDYELGLVLWIIAALLYLLPLWYSLFKDGFGQGQSWGKKAVNLQVIQEETNETCSYKKSFVRNGVMALLNFVPMVGTFIEPIVLLTAKDGKRLGDKAAKTIVIEVK